MLLCPDSPSFIPFADLKKMHDRLRKEHAYHDAAVVEYLAIFQCTPNYQTNKMYMKLCQMALYELRRTEFTLMATENKAGMNTITNDYDSYFFVASARKFIHPDIHINNRKKFSLLDEIHEMCSMLHEPPPADPTGLLKRLGICIHALNKVIKCVPI